MRYFVVLMAFGVAACGKGAGGGGGGGGGGGDAPTAIAPQVVADANAAIPKELAEKVKLVAGTFENRKVKALVVLPEGWKASDVIPGSYAPPDDKNLGFMTKYSVGTNCDGSCEPKAWAEVADKVEFAQFAGAGFKVQKDDKQPGSRVLIAAHDDGAVYVRAAFWKDGASRYYNCSAALEKEAAPLAGAFEKACRAMVPTW